MNMKERTEERLGLGDRIRVYYVWKWRLHVYAGMMALATLLCAAGWTMGLLCEGRAWLPDALRWMHLAYQVILLVVVSDIIPMMVIVTYDVYSLINPRRFTYWMEYAMERAFQYIGVAIVLGAWVALLDAWHPLAA